MKTRFTIFLYLSVVTVSLTACSGKSFRELLYQGIFDGSSQAEQMKNGDPTQPVIEKPTTYDQYEKERTAGKEAQ